MKRKTLRITFRLSDTLKDKIDAIRQIDHGLLTYVVEKAIQDYDITKKEG